MDVVIPALNEEASLPLVLAAIPSPPVRRVVVIDNASTDATAEVARRAGALVIHSPKRGKGNVIRQMARSVEADLYVLVDGDGTYPADVAPRLIDELVRSGAGMLVGTRIDSYQEGAFRVFHHFGNRLVSSLISVLFSARLTDVLSGYRVFTRDLFKLLQLRAEGFEVEVEFTLQTLAKAFEIKEVPIEYGARPPGSYSKLTTWSDGYVILKALLLIFKDYKPLIFFAGVSAILALASIAAGIGPVREFLETGLVHRVPRAILAAGLGVLSALSLAVGLILDTVAKYHQETIGLWKQHLKG